MMNKSMRFHRPMPLRFSLNMSFRTSATCCAHNDNSPCAQRFALLRTKKEDFSELMGIRSCNEKCLKKFFTQIGVGNRDYGKLKLLAIGISENKL